MNYWNEPYPKTIEELINKSDVCLEKLLQTLKQIDCKTLNEFYKINGANGEVQKQPEAFRQFDHLLNVKLNSKKNNEIKGLYLFGEVLSNDVVPIYVGISGAIFRRLKRHGWGKLHNEATLAYLKASSKGNYVGERKHLPYPELEVQQRIIRKYKIAILPESIDYDMYFMEVYFSGKLKTKWNSFKTH